MLTLVTRDGPRQLGEADVAEIRQRRDDSVVNGAVIGAVAGTVYIVTLLATFSQFNDGGDLMIGPAIMGGVLFAGMGAAAGAGIDALIARKEVIYRKPNGGAGIRVSPLFGRGRLGAAVAIGF